MYVGGPVWALDWCPRVNSCSDTRVRTEVRIKHDELCERY